MVTIGTAKSAAAIMALGLDPRFDLSSILVAGSQALIQKTPDRSVAWSSFLVDGDLAMDRYAKYQ